MKKLFASSIICLTLSLGLFAVNVEPSNESVSEPQMLSEVEMNETLGGLNATYICDHFFWCGDDLCGSGCTVIYW